MSLANRCRSNFVSRTERKGAEYFRAGKVRDFEQFGHTFTATVRGSSLYRVSLDYENARQSKECLVSCTCPYFQDTGPCKHLWAVILEVVRRKLDNLVPGSGLLTLVPEGDLLEPVGKSKSRASEDSRDIQLLKAYPETIRKVLQEFVRRGEIPSPAELQRQIMARKGSGPSAPPKAKPLAWVRELEKVAATLQERQPAPVYGRTNRAVRLRRISYELNMEESARSGKLAIDFRLQETKKNGEFGVVKELKVNDDDIAAIDSPEDRELLGLLYDPSSNYGAHYGYYSYYKPKNPGGYVREQMLDFVLPKLCQSGRLGWVDTDDPRTPATHPLAWEGPPAWRFEMAIVSDQSGKHWKIDGLLRRGEQTCTLEEPLMLLQSGVVVFPDRIARLDHDQAFGWIVRLRKGVPLLAPKKHGEELLNRLWEMPAMPPVSLPEELQFEQVRVPPQPRVTFQVPKFGRPEQMSGLLSFDYGGRTVEGRSPQIGVVDREGRKVYLRDKAAEKAALKRAIQAGAEQITTGYLADEGDVHIARKKLPQLVLELTREGWHVEAEGQKIRHAGDYKMSVTSGVDWFDLDTTFDFDGVTARLPELLAAVRRGDNFVELSDGSRGMLPEDWLQKYAPLAELGQAEDGKLRFKPSQGALLDALLAAQPDVDIDEGFALWRKKLRSFDGVKIGEQPKTFVGQLRDYQREGLGWLQFLNEFHFGGCLADDMGLGKTIQVLALLDERRTRKLAKGEQRRPSLVVVPKSLVQNWVQEAGRFAPQLKVLDYTGTQRAEHRERLDQYDLIVTTYGTLRLDVAHLRERVFDYAILDEAQAVKNADSQASKATRLVQADHRLAMTGTPIENHLGELWALFEFLNPGMLGRSSAMTLFTAGGKEKQDGAVQVLAQALRPFLLRRTKEQVLKELPAKTEQTLYCELEPEQQKLYNQLRDHYRALLTKTIEVQGLQKSKIHVLEALLRLRQAACHPGLLDKKRLKDPSAKLETLLEQLAEVRQEGHKVLVFSQFTSLLAIVRDRLDAENIVYEYLDGKTTRRQEKVDRFQTDPDCGLFLISLKAGGLGLNLTAADYVFILDPWWNPAVEAQAVDRAHRIGQTKPVFAYRLIAKGTVEEKILELQGSKKQLAEAIISADNSLIRSLTAEDLNLLLS